VSEFFRVVTNLTPESGVLFRDANVRHVQLVIAYDVTLTGSDVELHPTSVSLIAQLDAMLRISTIGEVAAAT
jgi:hypothetical protein